MYDFPTQNVPPMNMSDLFMAQNLGLNTSIPPPMSGAQSPQTMPMSGPQNTQIPGMQHLGDVINQYISSKQDQTNNSGLVNQILTNRMQPELQDASKSTFLNAISPPNQYTSPDQVMAQRYQNQLSPYTQGLGLANQNAELTGRLQTNNIQAQTGLPMAMAQLQAERMKNDIMAQTGMSAAQADISLKNSQAGYYGSALQRDLAEKAYEYANDPQMAQAKAMAGFLQGFGRSQPSMQPSSPMSFPSGGMSMPGGLPAAMPSPQSSSSVSPSQPTVQNIGVSPMGAMLGKTIGAEGSQIVPGPDGRPILMPIPGTTKIESGNVITFGPDGKPTSSVPQNTVARNTIENTINLLSGKLDELKKVGGAVSENQDYLTNMKNKVLSNPMMQSLQAGSKAQTIRSEMAAYVMQTMPDYMAAKGITPGMERTIQGQEMILKAIGADPGISIEAQKAALANLSTIAGTGSYAKQANGEQNQNGPPDAQSIVDELRRRGAVQ